LAIKRLKYSRRQEYLPVLQHWLRASPAGALAAAADLLTPVPLHPRRLRRRGFNQALLLAQAFTGVRLSRDALIRVRHTPPQTGLNPKERHHNVKGAFAVARPQEVAGKHVCLVDDVFTTGATVRECARTLRQAGAHTVTVLTVARTRDK
jgi:ComF family protein